MLHVRTSEPRGCRPVSGHPPPPSDPEFIVGENEMLQKEILIWLFLVHKLLDFWVPGAPPRSKGPSWEKMKFTVGKIWSGHFWYSTLLSPGPPPPLLSSLVSLRSAPPIAAHARALTGQRRVHDGRRQRDRQLLWLLGADADGRGSLGAAEQTPGASGLGSGAQGHPQPGPPK